MSDLDFSNTAPAKPAAQPAAPPPPPVYNAAMAMEFFKTAGKPEGYEAGATIFAEDEKGGFFKSPKMYVLIVGEEGGLIGDGLVRWYVDPIDGTNNFASGIPFFCVSIGATVADRLVAGVVYDPIRDELFAASGGIATCNGEPILSRGAPGDAEATLITGFPSYEPWPQAPSGPRDLERLGEMIRSFRTLRRLGSAALGLAYVAAGRADVAFGISSSPWDVAAGAILVEAAGGTYRAVPRSASSDRTPWLSPGYLAHVADFDPARSCLADIASLGER